MSDSIQYLIQLIAQLRNPNGGCPWDLKQTYRSMIPCVLEESYELVEAIEQHDHNNLKEELGDLLLQVVFLSRLAEEDGLFNFNDVVRGISEKIYRRHPHVFGDKAAGDETEALQRWNEMKAEERKEKGHRSILDNIPYAFPALTRAEKLQKRCAKIGFDWDNIEPVFDKVEEEMEELRTEIAIPNNSQRIEEELGDLFFAMVNLSRHLHCSPEETLRNANKKFETRFRKLESKVEMVGKSLNEMSLIEMDLLWNDVKSEE